MAEQRLSLRDYQRQLAERLRQADSARSASKLGMQVGAESWLIDLVQAGEVIPVPAVSPVPLTRPWLRGVSNVRGNLYSVVDFAAFLGAGSVVLSEQSRLVLLGDRYRSAAALLVDRLLGLRNPNELRPRARGGDAGAEAAAGASPWLRAEYDDEAGGRWKELDVAELVRHADFLSVAQ